MRAESLSSNLYFTCKSKKAKPIDCQISPFLTWVLIQRTPSAYGTFTDLKKAAIAFVHDLNIRISKRNDLRSAKNYRFVLVELLTEHWKDENATAVNAALKALPKMKGKQKPSEAPDLNDHANFLQTLCAFFWKGTDALMNKGDKPFPFCLDLRPIFGDETRPIWVKGKKQRVPTTEIATLAESLFDRLLTPEEARTLFKESGGKWGDNVRGNFHGLKTAHLRIEQSNQPYTNARYILATDCLAAYYLIFTSIAALNVSVADGLRDADERSRRVSGLC